MHLAWDVMVGLGTLLFLLSLWYALAWLFKTRHAEVEVVPAHRGVRGRARRRSAMEAGWVVTEVGRQPWIVHNYMQVEQAATTNQGVWITFLVVVGIYAHRGRDHDPGAAGHEPPLAGAGLRDDDESDVPYGPQQSTSRATPVEVRS